MRRHGFTERPDWRQRAEELGFTFEGPGGAATWTEAACYRFQAREVETALLAAVRDLVAMGYQAVDLVVRSDRHLQRLGIPRPLWDLMAESWRTGQKNMLERFDLAFDGGGTAKLLEINGDTPSGLVESALFQREWLRDACADGFLPETAGQYNHLREALTDAWGRFGLERDPLYFTARRDCGEDYATLVYLMECAVEAGLETRFIDLDALRTDSRLRLIDQDGAGIRFLCKACPWDRLVDQPLARHLPRLPVQWIEPPWKMILCSKGILPVLWEMFPDHPNLLPAFYEGDPRAAALGRGVLKPIHGTLGENIEIRFGTTVRVVEQGEHGSEPRIAQAFHPLRTFDGRYAVVGVWVVAGQPCGLGVREDQGPITTGNALFVPHYLE